MIDSERETAEKVTPVTNEKDLKRPEQESPGPAKQQRHGCCTPASFFPSVIVFVRIGLPFLSILTWESNTQISLRKEL